MDLRRASPVRSDTQVNILMLATVLSGGYAEATHASMVIHCICQERTRATVASVGVLNISIPLDFCPSKDTLGAGVERQVDDLIQSQHDLFGSCLISGLR